MTRLIDLIGKRFGRWTVLSRAENKVRTRWVCRCDCGIEKSVQGSNLVSGASISCGCYREELPRTNLISSVTKHAMTGTPTWNSWMAMNKRCYGKYSINYEKYGGRGISVCERWRSSFENFLSDMGLRGAGTSLDRVNVNGNYEPENCRWATRIQQARNTTAARIINYEGQDYCLASLAEKLGMSTQTVSMRISKGVPLSLPIYGGSRFSKILIEMDAIADKREAA